MSLSSQLRRYPLPAVTGAWVGEPSRDKPSRGPALNGGKSFVLARLRDPLSIWRLNTYPDPLCSTCWSNKGRELAGLSGEVGDMQGDISNLAL